MGFDFAPWISVDESLPADGLTVLVVEQAEVPIACSAYRWRDKWRVFPSMDEPLDYPVSHWMRIPALPVVEVDRAAEEHQIALGFESRLDFVTERCKGLEHRLEAKE